MIGGDANLMEIGCANEFLRHIRMAHSFLESNLGTKEEFEQRIHLLLHDGHDGNIVVRMKHRTLAIPFHEGHLDPHAFDEFMAELHAEENDYISVSVSLVGEICVMVFDAWQSKERLYSWP